MVLRNIISTLLILFSIENANTQQITNNGSRYEFDNTIYTAYEIGSVLEKDWEAKPYYDTFRSRIQKGKKIALLGCGVIAGAVAQYYFNEKGSTCEGPCIPLSWRIGLGGTIISLIGLFTNANGYTHLSKSIRIYNKNHPQLEELGHTFNIGITTSGFGISYTF